MPNGYQTKVLLWHQTQVNGSVQINDQPITSLGILILSWTLFDYYPPGALELWELAENEHLLVNRFTKHDHDNIVTTVSPVTGSNSVVTGSMDCRWGFVVLVFIRNLLPMLSFLEMSWHLILDLSFLSTELKCGISVRRRLLLHTMVRGRIKKASQIKFEVVPTETLNLFPFSTHAACQLCCLQP